MGRRVKGNDGEREEATEREGEKSQLGDLPSASDQSIRLSELQRGNLPPRSTTRRGRRGDMRAAAISSRWTRNPMRLGASPAAQSESPGVDRNLTIRDAGKGGGGELSTLLASAVDVLQRPLASTNTDRRPTTFQLGSRKIRAVSCGQRALGGEESNVKRAREVLE